MQATAELRELPYLDYSNEEDPYIDVLSQAECGEVRAVVYDLKKYWARDRLGFASYKLAPFAQNGLGRIGRVLYHWNARKLNPVLRARLGWMYDKVAARLAEALRAPTCYPDNVALPGFHVFVAPIKDKSIHFDGQHGHIDWGNPNEVDLDRPLSFTLAIALPRGGAGLNLWDVRREECMGLSSEQRQQLQRSRKMTFVPYKVGKLVCHSGYRMHQIADSAKFEAGDERITLQGHGVMRRAIWQLYW